VDDLTSQYFRTFHNHLPVISRIRFQYELITNRSTLGPDTSVLLLVICLISYVPNSNGMSTITKHSLYLATKGLLAQVQGSMHPSLPMIQASLLLATYEYASGRPEIALATIAGCGRMAYAACIHTRQQGTDIASKHKADESWNTWWGIIICERYIWPCMLLQRLTDMISRRQSLHV
jgi:hypothetical protein